MNIRRKRAVIIIPARLDSKRLKSKSLIDIQGKTVLQRTYESASKSKLAESIIVASENDEIIEHVLSFGGRVIKTTEKHMNGTSRIEEISRSLNYDIVINVQGDEPFIDPNLIDRGIKYFDNHKCNILTFKVRIDRPQEIDDVNTVKVVCNEENSALYFSRSRIPFDQENSEVPYFKHIGVYFFKSHILSELMCLPEHPIEVSEKLEQLRWLINGYDIQVLESQKSHLSINTMEDVLKANNFIIENNRC